MEKYGYYLNSLLPLIGNIEGYMCHQLWTKPLKAAGRHPPVQANLEGTRWWTRWRVPNAIPSKPDIKPAQSMDSAQEFFYQNDHPTGRWIRQTISAESVWFLLEVFCLWKNVLIRNGASITTGRGHFLNDVTVFNGILRWPTRKAWKSKENSLQKRLGEKDHGKTIFNWDQQAKKHWVVGVPCSRTAAEANLLSFVKNLFHSPVVKKTDSCFLPIFEQLLSLYSAQPN